VAQKKKSGISGGEWRSDRHQSSAVSAAWRKRHENESVAA